MLIETPLNPCSDPEWELHFAVTSPPSLPPRRAAPICTFLVVLIVLYRHRMRSLSWAAPRTRCRCPPPRNSMQPPRHLFRISFAHFSESASSGAHDAYHAGFCCGARALSGHVGRADCSGHDLRVLKAPPALHRDSQEGLPRLLLCLQRRVGMF